MGCTDCKLITAAIASPLAQGSTHTILEFQYGGVRGRSILGNIIACEGDGLLARIEGRGDAAQLFVEFKGALPSLIIEWALFVLQSMGIPDWAVKYFDYLYRGNLAR
eukprot:4138982-Pyramimonas_sp.AAC.1